jgi:hypothetical protein
MRELEVYVELHDQHTGIAHAAIRKKRVKGAIAQLGERLPCTQEVGSSILPGSTTAL